MRFRLLEARKFVCYPCIIRALHHVRQGARRPLPFGRESGAQHEEQSGYGATAMAERELGFEIQLGHGLVERGQVEERIVAEAAGTARSLEDEALDCAVGDMEGLAVARGDQHASVARG